MSNRDFRDKKRERAEMRERMSRGNQAGKPVPYWRIVIGVIIVVFAIVRIGIRMARSAQAEEVQANPIEFVRDINSANKKADENRLNKREITNYAGSSTDAVKIPITSKIEISLPEGFYRFPRFQNDTILLIAYANNFLLTCEKYELASGQTPEEQWLTSQRENNSEFSMLPYEKAEFMGTVGSNTEVENLERNFKFKYKTHWRYGHTRMIEAKGYRYYFTISGVKEDFKGLKKYLKYYLRVEK